MKYKFYNNLRNLLYSKNIFFKLFLILLLSLLIYNLFKKYNNFFTIIEGSHNYGKCQFDPQSYNKAVNRDSKARNRAVREASADDDNKAGNIAGMSS